MAIQIHIYISQDIDVEISHQKRKTPHDATMTALRRFPDLDAPPPVPERYRDRSIGPVTPPHALNYEEDDCEMRGFYKK